MLLLQFVSACFAVIVASATNIRPLVVWHGLGDYASSEGMLELQALFKKEYPSIFVHSVYISEDEDLDRRAGFVSCYHIQTHTPSHCSTVWQLE